MRQSNRSSSVDFSKDPKLQLFQQMIYECYTVNTTHSEVHSVDHKQGDGKLSLISYKHIAKAEIYAIMCQEISNWKLVLSRIYKIDKQKEH